MNASAFERNMWFFISFVPSSVTFSQDGLTLVVSDENGVVRVWQAQQPTM
jgi:hypothetical protein